MARPINVLEYLEAQAAARPGKTAFADAKTSLTYAQLAADARAVGCFVAGKTGPRRPVAVLANKSCAAVSAFLGIVYAGCFYAQLDPKHPAARLTSILDTLQPAVILTDEAGEMAAARLDLGDVVRAPISAALSRRPAQNAAPTPPSISAFSSDPATTQKSAVPSPPAPLRPAIPDPLPAVLQARRRAFADTDPLYAMFTSGSTGRPKGVLVCHRSVVDFIETFADTFGFDATDVFGNQAPLDFDVSTKDLYTGLKCGARVELLERQLFSSPARLAERLDARGVTALVWAVSALVIVSTVDALAETKPRALRSVLFSGETMPLKHLAYWRAHYPDARFVNLYGPTEITCNCTYYEIKPGETFAEESALPIGAPFPNERVFLLDGADREITAPGETGELCVAGTCLALGYLNDPERTRASFCRDPRNPGWPETIYRTGDLACWGADGLLYFRSRRDFQIKHMGHRIELQEIELHLQAVPGVDRCCCVFFKERQRVVAFYEGAATARELVAALRAKLPSYMIPQGFERLDRLPVTPNGKLDRAKLRASAE